LSVRGPVPPPLSLLPDAPDMTLVETRVERTDSTVRIVHVFEYGPQNASLLTEPFEGYGSDVG
jgi:hypothetical protein